MLGEVLEEISLWCRKKKYKDLENKDSKSNTHLYCQTVDLLNRQLHCLAKCSNDNAWMNTLLNKRFYLLQEFTS